MGAEQPQLFAGATSPARRRVPLAHRLRPRLLDEVVGQEHLTAQGSWFRTMIDEGRAGSVIFWGPPGVGKTTLAHIMAEAAELPMHTLSAVSAGKREVQQVLARAEAAGATHLLFLDEIHRFNKAQQDVLLPAIERGSLVLVGATTENPSFSLNNALLSRCRVVVLDPLDAAALERMLRRAIDHIRQEHAGFALDEEAVAELAAIADGDGRYALNLLEELLAADDRRCWSRAEVRRTVARKAAAYDRDGDFHYDLISALHKSVRDSDADAACYWLARMLEAGEEPRYLIRRMIRMATEDVGLADPRALSVALDALRMFETLGSPEGEQGLFAAAVYLALAPKSNALYMAEKAARRLAADSRDAAVPLHLRNAPTRLMKELGHGAGYRYAHDDPDGVVAQRHFPDGVAPEAPLYRPVARGFERTLGERIRWLEQQRERRGG
ncbi:MAG: replication-associated recombination protein A [Zetaproteobacteria bacterium]|nr:MAG: replication-associated recombination protein A [Zetaproteobacteria bacterium]